MGNVFAQTPDTVIVYEYKYITDTVWVDSEPGRMNYLTSKSIFLSEPVLNEKSKNRLQNTATISENDIITANKKDAEMKYVKILGLTMFLINSSLMAQDLPEHSFGIYLKGNLSSQVFEYPTYEDEYGSYMEEYLKTFGGGIRYEYIFSKGFSLIGNIGYLQRGCFIDERITRCYDLNNQVVASLYPERRNLFHNTNADLLFKVRLKRSAFFNPYIYAGIRIDYNWSEVIEYQIDDETFKNTSGYYGFNKFTYGYLIGGGVNINKRFGVEVELNSDLRRLIKNEYLKTKHVMLSLNIIYYLDHHFKLE